ncbi:MAG: hypothetical protein ACOYOT_04270 [Bacteroidales bacterium]
MKKATIILVILFSALTTHVDAQNLTKEQCLKYISDMSNELVQHNTSEACPLENFRLEYETLKWEKHCDSSSEHQTLTLSGLYIDQDGTGDWICIKNSKGEVFKRCDKTAPGQKDRLEKLLKALQYLSKFTTKDPFAN